MVFLAVRMVALSDQTSFSREYQELSDDAPPCPKITLGSIVTMFKSDRVFTDPPKDLFAKQ